eukprot:GEMP01011499.1.p1 GENE.GEMP01011499.1~~GEMP01011499.1.p1  ORF type:complete len:530 (+),score=115.81 GEMP01011499.1:114-1703(+)
MEKKKDVSRTSAKTKANRVKHDGKEKNNGGAVPVGINKLDKNHPKAPSDMEGKKSDSNDDEILAGVDGKNTSDASDDKMSAVVDGNQKSDTNADKVPTVVGAHEASGTNSDKVPDDVKETKSSTNDENEGEKTRQCVMKGDTSEQCDVKQKSGVADAPSNGDSEGRSGQAPSSCSTCHGCRSLKRLVTQVRLDRRSYALQTRMLRREMHVLRDHMRMILQPIPHTYLQPFHDFPPAPPPLSAVNTSGASPSSATKKRPRSPARTYESYLERGRSDSGARAAQGPPNPKSRPKKWLGTESLLDQELEPECWPPNGAWEGENDYEGGGVWGRDQNEGWEDDGESYWAGDWSSWGKPRRGALGHASRYARGKINLMSNMESKTAELETRGMKKLNRKISPKLMEGTELQGDQQAPSNASVARDGKKTESHNGESGANASAGHATGVGGNEKANDGSVKEPTVPGNVNIKGTNGGTNSEANTRDKWSNKDEAKKTGANQSKPHKDAMLGKEGSDDRGKKEGRSRDGPKDLFSL